MAIYAASVYRYGIRTGRVTVPALVRTYVRSASSYVRIWGGGMRKYDYTKSWAPHEFSGAAQNKSDAELASATLYTS